MSGFWRGWFAIWCVSIGLFGAVLSGGAFEATSTPVRLLLAGLRGPAEAPLDPTLRFSLAVMGAVSIGWAVTLFLVIRAAIALEARGRPLWTAMTVGLVSWFVIDSTLSVATGFGLNVVPNSVLLIFYGFGLIGSGCLRRAPA
ncbi:MAG: hypothetical protein KKC14_03195 [Alphaproteobacteria bacterium]|nr:hypothetical protein [Alphaproteobacteria bacterium]